MKATTQNQPSAIFFSMLEVPIYCNLLWQEKQAARNCPKGDIKLAFDPHTGLIINTAFDPTKLGYDQDYENSLHYSPRFQKYADDLAQDLVKRHNLYQKDIIEIGCGKGDFLVSLCQLGDNRGVGFDPTYVSREEHQSVAEKVTFVKDLYSEKYQNYQADLICCRHTLEHVPDPGDLLQPLRKAIGDRLDTVVFFEVPDSLHTFRNLAVWDIIYEHCAYYVPYSMVQAFVAYDFEVRNVQQVFDDQFLCLEAVPVAEGEGNSKVEVESLAALQQDLDTFNSKFQAKIAHWSVKISEIAQKGQKAVVWGAGSKGVTFLNLLDKAGVVEYVVDLNPRKQGMYLAGTGQEIVPPEFLQTYQPDVVMIANPIYEGEIREMVTGFGLQPEFLCI